MSGERCKSDVETLNPTRVHTFMEIDHEIISMVILLPSAESFKKGCCQLQSIVSWGLEFDPRPRMRLY